MQKKFTKKLKLYAGSFLAVASIGLSSMATTSFAKPETAANNKVTVCHETGSATKLYVSITVSAAGAVNGHLSHHDGDVIVPFEYEGVTYSKNWDDTVAPLLDEDCQVLPPQSD